MFAARPYVTDINSAVNSWASSIQTGTLTDVAKIIDLGFDTKVLLIITLPLVGLLLYKGSTLKAGLLVGAMGADAVLLQAAKTFITSPRPTNALLAETDNSFPKRTPHQHHRLRRHANLPCLAKPKNHPQTLHSRRRTSPNSRRSL